MKTNGKNIEVQEIIDKSGNVFHSKVVKLLRELDWSVLVSPYYSDNFTDKPREIDIITEKKFDIKHYISDWLGTLDVNIFIECKYINVNTVFWFDNKDKNRATQRIMNDTGMDHPDDNINIKEHHYFTDVSVAKLFSSEKSKSEDNDLISKAVNQNLNALVYYRNKSNIFSENSAFRNKVLKRIPYPLIVVNSFDKFFRTNMDDPTSSTEPITEPFQLEVNYAYIDDNKKSCNEYFLIDIVSIDKLSDFLLNLENTDIKAIKGKISWEEAQKNSDRQRNSGLGNNSSR